MAPAGLSSLTESEVGIEWLEDLTAKRPDDLENHLRLAEAYLVLGDTKPALPHLSLCFGGVPPMMTTHVRLQKVLAR